MNKEDIIKAYTRIRTIDNTIPDDVLDFMKESALKQLSLCSVSQQRELLLSYAEYHNKNFEYENIYEVMIDKYLNRQ